VNIRLLPRAEEIVMLKPRTPGNYSDLALTPVRIYAGLVDVDEYPELRPFTVNHRKCGICQRMNGRHRQSCAYRPERRHP
jgi:hypothetical protein